MEEILVNIFNEEFVYDVEPTFNISFEDIQKGYSKLFSDTSIKDINIVFVKPEYIQELNQRYRDVDAPTDVLSFQLEKDMSKGEIYISPEYVYQTYKSEAFEEEILRLIIHGTLHILDMDHKESLNDSPNEEMFVLQEDLLLKYKKLCS
jgi:probable rRNA maturation factor